MGPILFSIYINDLPSIPQHSFHQCYVEDTKLIINFKLQDHMNAIVKLKADFSRISNWTMRNQLLKNPNRTKFIIFGSRAMVSKAQNFLVNLLGKEIKPVASAKDLGVVLDPILTYNNHPGSTVSSCMAHLGQINQVKHALDRNTLTIIINALVFNKLYFMFGAKTLNTT